MSWFSERFKGGSLCLLLPLPALPVVLQLLPFLPFPGWPCRSRAGSYVLPTAEAPVISPFFKNQ